MSEGPSDRQPWMPNQVLEAIRRHAEDPEVVEYSLLVGKFGLEWQSEAEFEIENVHGVLVDLPEDILSKEAREEVMKVAVEAFEERDG